MTDITRDAGASALVEGNDEGQMLRAEAVIDRFRFADDTDRILSRYEEVDTIMPSFDELVAIGVDVVRLADALEAGLNAETFGRLVESQLDIESFNATLAAGISIPTFNEGMEHLVEISDEAARHPDPVDRILCRHGDCSDARCSA